MGRIKTRESVKDIKILDKAAVASERMKTALVRSKDQAENLMDGSIIPVENGTLNLTLPGNSSVVLKIRED